jgi:phosphotransferase system HPr-like phosphotransfer protein
MKNETQHTVSESADKITVTTKVKRGEGTRDEDRIKVKVKGNQADEVVAKLNAVVDNLHDTQDTLRAMQPGDDE